ncbi:hypothetical protein CCHR01_19456 [Colletotrichum chrysophilum]|uniref:Uncharacterized protein n=1 Tax=Colletotrichum chrysophilum TaxID=1836956 RepID=A0AAD8ZY89_9PEZI|nr:hypothetical protein CCHR01_19456 [Colletotrichum chrysophilum]
MDTLPPILLIMMICWTRAFGSVMMFRSAVSDLVDRRFLRRGGILRWIHVTRPATETSAHRCFHDQRRMNGKETWIQEKKTLDMGNHFDMARRPWRSPIPLSLFPRHTSFHGARKHMNHL